MNADTQILVGLGIGIVCLIYMIMKTKIHTFLALIIATVIVGIIGGIGYQQIVASITKGFGGTRCSRSPAPRSAWRSPS